MKPCGIFEPAYGRAHGRLSHVMFIATVRRRKIIIGKMTGMNSKTSTRDMTTGPIISQVVLFSLPLMLGNLFQMLYNTVDSIVVGRFVSTQALAAVGSTAMIVNIMVFFFNGFSVRAGDPHVHGRSLRGLLRCFVPARQ